MDLQFATQAYQSRSTQLLSQQCINAFVEPTPKEGKTVVPFFGTPGLTLFSRMGDGPILGMHVMANNLYVVSKNKLYEITKTAALAAQASGGAVTATLIGSTTFGSSLVSMADNGQQLVMVDGTVGWIYQPGGLNIVTTGTVPAGTTVIPVNITGTIGSGDILNISLDSGATFTTTSTGTYTPNDPAIGITDALPSQVTSGAIIIDATNVLGEIVSPAFESAATVTYMDGYFVFDAAGTRQFFISGLNDGTQYSGLDFATATAASADVLAVLTYHEQLLIFTGAVIEVWWDTGNAAFPFQRYDAALIARGLASPHAICSEDNTVFWMGEDGIFYRLEGFTPKRISTFALEHAWAQYPQQYLDSSCFVIDQEGHKFIVVNFPSGRQTYVYDISTGLWHQRESWGTAWV